MSASEKGKQFIKVEQQHKMIFKAFFFFKSIACDV